MNPDRLGILTDEVCPNFAVAVEWIARQGMKHVEARVIDGKNIVELDDAAVAEVRRKVEHSGLFISAIASPLFKCALDPNRPVASGDRFGQKEEGVESHFTKLARVIDIAKQLSAFRSAHSLPMQKHSRAGKKTVDAKQFVDELALTAPLRLNFLVKKTGAGTIKPHEFVGTLFDLTPEETKVLRLTKIQTLFHSLSEHSEEDSETVSEEVSAPPQ